MSSSLIFIVVVMLSTSRGQTLTSTMECEQFCEGQEGTVTVILYNSSLSACTIPVTRFAFSFQAKGASGASQICFQNYPECNTTPTPDNCTCSLQGNEPYYKYEYTFLASDAKYQGGTFGFDTGCLDSSFNPIPVVNNIACVNITEISAVLLFGILGREIAVIVVVTIVVFALLIFVQYVYIAYRRGLWPFDGKEKKPKCTWREVLFFLLGVLVPVPLAVYIIIAAFLKFRPFANDNGKWWQVVLVFLALLLGSLFVISIFIDYYGKVWLFVITGNCLRKKEDAVDVPKGLLIFLFVFGILCIVAWAIYMIVAVKSKKWPFDPPVKDEPTPDYPLGGGANGDANPERSDPYVNE